MARSQLPPSPPPSPNVVTMADATPEIKDVSPSWTATVVSTPGQTRPPLKLSAMQLFYELKQKFPTAPDPVVSECIRQSGNDPERCAELLHASCSSRGFLPASVTSSSPAVVVPGGGRRLSTASRASSFSSNASSSTTASRARSLTRTSMCALAERPIVAGVENTTTTTTASSSAATSRASSQTPPLSTSSNSSGVLEPQVNTNAAAKLRSKLRPTFLDTRNVQGRNREELRPPFQGGPLQQPHKHARRSSAVLEDQFYSETYECSVNRQTVTSQQRSGRARGSWGESCASSREPTPPPRPPLPASMVHDPFLCCERLHEVEQQQQDYEVSVNCSLGNVHVTSTCSSPVGGPVGSPVFPVRHTASLHVHPTPHFLSRPASLTSVTSEPRSYTSVNLTLRPPTSDPQPPIDIRSASRLTYSTSSYNPVQGFQSQLHIQIGGGVGTVSAVRTCSQPPMGVRSGTPARTPPTSCGGGGPPKQHQVLVRTVSLPDVKVPADKLLTPRQAGLARQMERKARLEAELKTELERLRVMKGEVEAMESDLRTRRLLAPLRGLQMAPAQRLARLREEVRNLQEECKRMTQEVDLHGSQVPLGETDEEFYQNIYTGQRGFVLPANRNIPHFEGSWNSVNRPSSTGRPASSNINRSSGLATGIIGGGSTDEDEDGPHWTCSVCTFRNHPALGKCEQCEMPRISLDINEAGTQDIHIRVTHSNFPSRRVVHSWVV